MILIIGGAYQGKLTYAKKTFFLKEEDIDYGENCPLYGSSARCLNRFHVFAKRLSEEDGASEKFLNNINYDIIISDEIGCGVIPIDKEARRMRENAGRLLCILAEKAEKVIRIHCGIPVIIKGGGL